MGRWALAAMRKQKGERARALLLLLLLLHGLFEAMGKKGYCCSQTYLGSTGRKTS